MRSALVLMIVPLALACARAPRETLPERPLSVTDHLAEAERHERVADRVAVPAGPATEAAGPPIDCIDQPLAGVPYSGGEPLTVMRPCWTRVGTVERARREAERQRREAREHRATAAALVEAERTACAGLGEDEVAAGPFAHPADLRRVEPYREAGELRGVRIWFAEVPGLSADWMLRASHCQMARAAVLGYPRTFMARSPLSLPDIATSVRPSPAGVVVTIRAERGPIAAAALGRARDLLARR